jgi:hypothetical protein
VKKVFLAAAFAALTASAGYADTIVIGGTEYGLQSLFYEGSQGQPKMDCPGVFGSSFPTCVAFGSPIVAKFDVAATALAFLDPALNTGTYPTIEESDFTLTIPSNTGGTFVYNPDDAEDPAIRFWTTKAGNDFYLWWLTAVDAAGNALLPENALTIPLGEQIDWRTNQQQGLSHISFYNTGRHEDGGGGGDGGGEDGSSPEPATLALFGLGLVAAGRRLRR